MTPTTGSPDTTATAARPGPPAAPRRPGDRATAPGTGFGMALVAAWTLALTAAALWPLASPGMLLLRDMVVPPHPALTDAAFGLGSAAARATPQDAVLALAGGATDAGVVARLLLAASFFFGGLAAAELARRAVGAGIIGQLAAVTLLLWNPYVAERLLQGQWSLVIAMVLLPAVAVASIAGARWWRATAMAVAGLTPTGALLGAVVAVASARTGRDRLIAAATAVAVSAPWLVVSLPGAGGGGTTDPAGAGAFAARAENLVGTLGAVAGLGGIWNKLAVPPLRETGPAALAVFALMALFIIGFTRAWGTSGAKGPRGAHHAPGLPNRALIVLAAIAIAVPVLLATPPGIAAMEWALSNIPGAGLARDTQKFAALAVPGYVILAAAGAESLADALPPAKTWLAAAFAVLVAIAAVPDLPRAMAPLTPVAPWSGWGPVSGLVAMDDAAVAVLPGGSYRIIDGRPAYDPAVKTLPAPVISTGDLTVSGVTVGGEGTTAAIVERTLLEAPDDAVDVLRRHGVGWVLLENSPGEFGDSDRVLRQLEILYEDGNLRLHRVPGAIDAPEPADRTPAIIGLAVWAAALAAGPLSGLRPRARSGRSSGQRPREHSGRPSGPRPRAR